MAQKKKLRDEEALSTEEINRVRAERKRKIKKTLTTLLIMGIISGIGYFISLINWKKIINDREKAKRANMVVVDEKLSPKFLDDDF